MLRAPISAMATIPFVFGLPIWYAYRVGHWTIANFTQAMDDSCPVISSWNEHH
jgi:hypothetical protein